MKTNQLFFASATVLALAISGCTKPRPYKEVYKEEVLDRGLFDTKSLYLYAPSVVDSARTSTASRPYWMGEQKLVKLKFAEDGLKLVEVEGDARFTDNPTNEKPVLTIPGEYLEYRCAKNEVDECSNKEEVNNDLPWSARSKFKPKLAKLEVQETNLMPTQLANLVIGCYKDQGFEVVSAKWENDAINFELEHSYGVNVMCADFDQAATEHELFSGLTVKVREHFSIVKRDSLVTKGYEPVKYPEADSNTFGFFETEQHKLDVDNRDQEKGMTKLMNRWNPQAKEVVYYLSAAYRKPELAHIREATLQSVKIINDGLAQSGANLRLVAKDMTESTRIGDLRTNALVLVEDPIAGGLLGYGPTIADPLTGEIIHGRVVMYYGNLVKYIKLTYDDIVAERRREAGAPPAQPPVDAPKEEPKEEPKDDAGLLMALKATPAASGLDAEVRKLTLESATDLRDKPRQKMNLGQMRELVRAQGYDMTRIQERYRIAQAKANDAGKAEDLLPISEVNEKADRLSTLSEHCGYPGEMANFQGAVGSAIDDVLPKGELKPWEELTDAEKVQITRLILPTTWVPTLIHELGHNLGLRHNFAGSMDKANHYTAKETEKLGLKRIMPYSSMMEYPNKEINALQVMGKYDIAALRFGYTRTVEQLDIERDADGKPKVDDEGEYVIKTAKNDAGEEVPVTVSVAVPGTLAELKAKTDPKLTFTNYEYCTDEGVGANPTCNRFDEGTTMAEVAQNLIDSYDEMYTRRNFRSGRRDFSLMNDGDYAISINRTFRGLRLFFEMYETLVTRFNIPAEAWEEEPFLADLNSAVEKAGDFYLRVMRTPDVFCSLASIDEPNEPVGLQMLYAINKRSVSCFEPAIIALAAQNGLVVHGQGGRSFRSLKAPGSENPYADQIDVRGIWIDKLLAEQSLLARRIGSPLFDGETLNFLQKPGFADKALKAFEEILDDRLTGELVVTTAQGKQVSLGAGGWPLSVTHKIVRPMDPFIRRAFSLPQGDNTTFVNELVFNVNAWMPSREHDWAARPFIRLFDVWEVSLTDSQDYDKSLRVLDLGTRRFLAGPQQAFARKIMNEMDQVRLMTQVKPADLAKILADLKKPQPPGPAPEPKPDPKQNEDRAAKQQRIAIAGLSLETFRKRVADAKDWTIEQLLEILKQAGAEGEIKERELARAVIAVSDALEIARAAKPGEEQDAKILEVVKASKKEAVVKLVIEKVISEAIVPAEPVPTETIEAKVRKLGPAPIEKFLKNGFKSERVYSDLLMVLTKSGR